MMNNHDGTFREEGLLRGLAVSGKVQSLGGMGIVVDLDNDGHPDILPAFAANQLVTIREGQGIVKGRPFR